MNILIMGAGNIGTALGRILRKDKANKVEFWDAMPGFVKGQRDLESAASGAEAVFFCLPSFAVRDAAESIVPYLRRRTPVICVAKGIENKTYLTVDKLLAKVLPKGQPFAVVFGPMFAQDLAAGRPGFATAAGPGRRTAVSLFEGTNFFVRESGDLSGVAAAGALKNIYALGLGMLSAESANDNACGAYSCAAIGEMMDIVRILGGRPETALSLAGIGDLIATGFSKKSKNRKVGMLLGSGRRGRSEGTRALHSLMMILGKRARRFPLLETLSRVASGASSAAGMLPAIEKSLCRK